MSKDLQEVLDFVEDMQPTLKSFVDMYREVEDSTDQSTLTVEERSDFVALFQAHDKLEDAYKLLKKLDSTIIAEGELYKNANDRYQVQSTELSSGSYVEYFFDNRFVPSKVEHGDEDYYIEGLGKGKSI